MPSEKELCLPQRKAAAEGGVKYSAVDGGSAGGYIKHKDYEKTEGEKMSLPYNKKLIPRAKELRRNMTAQERHLWYDFLREYPVRFQRQKTISSYVADFYCSKANLVIELDGSQHYTPEGKEYDKNRTYVIEQFGVKVIRFSNYDVDTNFYGVCTVIDRMVKERLGGSPSVTT